MRCARIYVLIPLLLMATSGSSASAAAGGGAGAGPTFRFPGLVSRFNFGPGWGSMSNTFAGDRTYSTRSFAGHLDAQIEGGPLVLGGSVAGVIRTGSGADEMSSVIGAGYLGVNFNSRVQILLGGGGGGLNAKRSGAAAAPHDIVTDNANPAGFFAGLRLYGPQVARVQYGISANYYYLQSSSYKTTATDSGVQTVTPVSAKAHGTAVMMSLVFSYASSSK